MINMKCLKKIKPIDVWITVFFIILSVIALYIYKKRAIATIDFNGNRIICGYVLNGINPLKHVGEPTLVDYLGIVPVGYGNLPYGLFLGNFFYFGFLNLKNALFAFRIESILLMILNILVAKKFFSKIEGGTRLFYYFILFSIFSIHVFCSYTVGNIGHMICMLIIISIFLSYENFILSGLAFSLAMIKPQVAFPFCITFLFLKKYKVVLFAIVIDVIASFICSFLVEENVLKMFFDFFNVNVGNNATVYGLFTIFYKINSKALFPSMFIGITILILIHILMRNIKNELIQFAFPSLVASFWSYSWGSDSYILIIPAIVFLYVFFTKNDIGMGNKVSNMLLLVYCFVFLFFVAIKSVFRDYLLIIFNNMYQEKNYIERVVISNTICYIIVLIGILILIGNVIKIESIMIKKSNMISY